MPQHHIGQTVDAVAFSKQVDTTNELVLPTTGRVSVMTRHSTYEFDLGQLEGRGGVLGLEWRPARIEGSTFGGSMIALRRIIPGALLEFIAFDEGEHGKVYTTSPIENWEMP